MQSLNIQARDLRFNNPLTMDVFYTYTYSTAAWLGVQAIALMIFPKLIVTMLSVEARKPTGLLWECPYAALTQSDYENSARGISM